jgi:hypothetical protein
MNRTLFRTQVLPPSPSGRQSPKTLIRIVQTAPLVEHRPLAAY